MAKKKTTQSASNYSLVKTCAFWALILAGVSKLISFILGLCAKIFSDKINQSLGWMRQLSNICSFISEIALFITVWLAAWDFVKGKGKTWRTVYWVFFAISLLALLGFNILGFMGINW